MLTFKRPGSGLKPRCWEKVIGMTARRNIGKDTILQWDDLVPSASSDTTLSELKKMEQGVDSVTTRLQRKQQA
jgi:hypothetical protein